MTQIICSLCLGLGVALVVLDLGLTARSWSLGPAALTETLPPARPLSFPRPVRKLLDRLRDSSDELSTWEEIAFSLASHIRAGETLAQALRDVAAEGSDAPYSLLKKACHEYEAGVPILEALNAAARGSGGFERLTGVFELGLVYGGDLPSLLCRTADEMRRQRTRRSEAKSKLVEARLTALLLTILPWAIGLFSFSQDPRIGRTLTLDPQGRLLFLLALGLWCCGVFAVASLVSGVSSRGRK